MLSNPFKTPHPLWAAVSVAAACAGLWLVFWPPGSPGLQLLGGPLLAAGGAVAAVQFSLSRSSALERQVAPAELQAWLMLAFVAAVLAMAVGNADMAGSGFLDRGGRRLIAMLAPLVALYVVLSSLLRKRQADSVVKDERDLQIASRAALYGRGALVFQVATLMAILGFSPPDRLQWATPAVIASHLFVAMFVGWVVEYAAVVALYWRGRW